VGSSALWVFERVATGYKHLFVLNGSYDAYLFSTVQNEVYRWMDHWVRGEDNGVDTDPRVRVDFETTTTPATKFGEIIQAQPGWTNTLRDWPAPGTQWHTLHLTTDGKLDDHPSQDTAEAQERRYFYPAGTELAGDARQFALPAVEWASLSYRSSPVTVDTAIVGSPQLRFYASSQQSNTDFMVVLHDVAPNGDVTYLQRAYLRASRRAVSDALSTPQYVFHPHLKDEPLRPGQVYELKVSVPPVAYMLRAGHRLELLIAAPSPIPTPGWGLTPIADSGFNTVYQGSGYASQLRIPRTVLVRFSGKF
jgi:putative CocE/NonD family hydrolase